MSKDMVPGLGSNIMEMKSRASSSINGAARGEGISDSRGSAAHAQYLHEAELKHGLFVMLAALGFPVTREASRLRSGASWDVRANRVSDDLEWDPLNLLPSDPTAGWQPAVFAVEPSSSNDDKDSAAEPGSGQLMGKVNRFANIASLLCVLDCSVLPVLMVVMQLGGLAMKSKMHALHELGHRIALYFVLPVGGTAALSNFVSHGKKRVSIFALLGLLGIYATNGHGGPLRVLPHRLHHRLHDGLSHRIMNIACCALLIGSNYASHKIIHASGGCDHHGHGHDCGHKH
jgi:hypothetical protein